MKICGIYTITNIKNRKIYIGYSKNIKHRISTHRSFLRLNKHKNDHLQSAWNKYGEENFLFEILWECEENFLASEEHYWCNLLNTHDPEYGYNCKPTHPENKYRISEITKKKLSEKQIGWAKHWGTYYRYNLLGTNFEKIENLKKYCLERKYSYDVVIDAILDERPAFGFLWRKELLMNELLIPEYSQAYRQYYKLHQYDLEGNFIKEWESVLDLPKEMGCHSSCISKCHKREYHKTCGFKWKFVLKNKKELSKL